MCVWRCMSYRPERPPLSASCVCCLVLYICTFILFSFLFSFFFFFLLCIFGFFFIYVRALFSGVWRGHLACGSLHARKPFPWGRALASPSPPSHACRRYLHGSGACRLSARPPSLSLPPPSLPPLEPLLLAFALQHIYDTHISPSPLAGSLPC